MEITWTVVKFEDLKAIDVYNIMQLRSEVFVVEQNCVYQDADGKDPKCYHLLGMRGDQLVAYTRLLPKGLSFIEASIGRVVSSPSIRGTGIGRTLMLRSINEIKNLFGEGPIRIGAQYYLLQFYSSLGFKQEGEIYLEDGIQHVEMVKL